MAKSLLQQFTKPSRWPSPGSDDSSRLALDLAMGIKPVAALLDDYGLSAAQMRQRMADPNYQAQIREYRRIWSSPMNAAERVRIKTAVMVEDGLTDLWQIMTNAEMNPSVRLDAHKHLTRLADVEPQRSADAGGSRFSVTINLPGQEQMVVEANAVPVAETEEPDLIEDAA